MDVVSKSLGDSYSSAEFNQSNNELENAITSAGITLSSGDLFQIGKAIANYAANGDFYTDSGAADAYVLAAQGSKQSPTSYADGTRARFIAGNTNTGASTVNVATLGVKSIVFKGIALVAGQLTSGEIAEIEFDLTNDRFELTSAVGAIGIVQTVHVADGAVATGTTVMPFDDTIPQNTEGDEYITASITPTSSANKLIIECQLHLSSNASSRQLTSALFQDSTADALTASTNEPADLSDIIPVNLKYEMTAGTTSAIAFKIRAGVSISGTTTFNGSGGSRFFGGVINSYLRITEIKP